MDVETLASLVLLLRRPAGTSAAELHDSLAGSRLQGLDSPLVIRHEQFTTRTDEERDGRDLPQFAVSGYDAIVFVSTATPHGLDELLASRSLAEALGDVALWADTDTSHALRTRDRIAFGPGDSDVVTLGCLRRQQHQGWPDFDSRWLAHTRLTDGLRDCGLLLGYVQSHLSGPPSSESSFRVGDLHLAWAPWDGVTRGFWVDDQALARRNGMGAWLAECADDERTFIDHSRSCHHLTRRTIVT